MAAFAKVDQKTIANAENEGRWNYQNEAAAVIKVPLYSLVWSSVYVMVNRIGMARAFAKWSLYHVAENIIVATSSESNTVCPVKESSCG